MNGAEFRGMWIQPTVRVRGARVSWIAEGPVDADEARALALAIAAAVGTVLGFWLAGLVA